MFSHINDLLHHERGERLARMPRISGTLLSAGCSGTWYFEWVQERYGTVNKHIGLELYSPKPDDLPRNVEWIANTVGDMNDVNDQSVDLVFSGQNLEHLWPEDVVGFFVESARVTKPGGFLVIDSPNRSATADLNWSHPEHTVEMTPLEAVRLTTLAGFDVSAVHGIWLARDPSTGRALSLEPQASDGEWTLDRRLDRGRVDPDNAFLWWIEARRSDRMPDEAQLEAEMRLIFNIAWPERVGRTHSHVGTRIRTAKGIVMRAEKTAHGALMFGPYMPLKAGRYLARFKILTVQEADRGIIARCDVVGDQGRELTVRELTAADIRFENGRIDLPFVLETLEFGIQVRLFTYGAAIIECEAPVDITNAAK
jgi:SAM-dependent methyltransferase